jgi:hypothetical protein
MSGAIGSLGRQMRGGSPSARAAVASKSPEAVSDSCEEVDRLQPNQPSPFGARVHPDPVTGIAHTAYLSVHADGNPSGTLQHADTDSLVNGQHETPDRAVPMRLASFEESQDRQHPSMRGVGLG